MKNSFEKTIRAMSIVEIVRAVMKGYKNVGQYLGLDFKMEKDQDRRDVIFEEAVILSIIAQISSIDLKRNITNDRRLRAQSLNTSEEFLLNFEIAMGHFLARQFSLYSQCAFVEGFATLFLNNEGAHLKELAPLNRATSKLSLKGWRSFANFIEVVKDEVNYNSPNWKPG